MELSIFLPFLTMLLVHHTHSTYVALAPSQFHLGWKYAVQVTVQRVTSGQLVTVTGNIYNIATPRRSLGSGQVTLSDGQTDKLEIDVRSDGPIEGNEFTLELVGTGGLTFTNSTTISLDPLTHLAFIQTDKKIYKPGQTVRIRSVIVDQDLIPVAVPMQLSIENPFQSIMAQYTSDGTKIVFENILKIMEFPDLGPWKITLTSDILKLKEELVFIVEEYVLPTFEVSASVNPGYLVMNMAQTKATVSVSAKYTYGKSVMGDVQVMIVNTNKFVNSQITDPNGMKNVEIDLREEIAKSFDTIDLVVKVTDDTKRAYNTTVSIKVVSQPIVVEIDTKRSDMVYHNGTSYRAVVKFADAAGKPLTSEFLENDLQVRMTELYQGNQVLFERAYNLSAGMTEMVISISSLVSNQDSLQLKAFMSVNGVEYQSTETISKYLTLGNSTLNARWINTPDVLSMGKTASFVVDVPSSSQFDSLSYVIVSRGNIQTVGTVTSGQTKMVTVTADMCPNGKLLVYGITTRTAGSIPEVIADSLDLTIDHCQNKKVTPTVIGGDTLKTGSNATVRMTVGWTDTSEVNPVGVHEMFLLGVDTSNILLQGHNDIDSDRVQAELNKFTLTSPVDHGGRFERDIMPGRYPYHQYPKSTGELFQEAGLTALTDVEFYIEHPYIYFDDRVFAAPVPGVLLQEMGPVNAASETVGGSNAQLTANTVTIRKEFPETWIWISGLTNENGILEYSNKLPDSITSWTLTAFAVKNNSELAVTTNPFKLNAFNPFFVSLNLPYSIRRTETFELRATVFNYEKNDMQTSVLLTASKDFDIVGDALKSVLVKSNSASSVTFMILAKKVATIDLQVTATAPKSDGTTVTDQINSKLIVRPEGIERMRAVTFPVILSAEQPEFSQKVVLDFSPWTLADVVPDSRRASVKITGDMMGNALEGIDKLVTQPTGCGEQNMITTIPNIYAMKYLTAIDDLNPEFERKATGYMVEGYQRQMTFKRDDDGYSAWGQSDDASSTWLTSFVLRSFASAKMFIPTTVQESVLTGALNFLFNHQNSNGQFYELGRVIHEDMTGGAGTGDSLSTYIVLSMMEAKLNGLVIPSQYEANMTKAVNFVRNVANSIEVKSRQFLAAILAYTLALINPNDTATTAKVVGLIQNVVDIGAPWLAEEKTKSDSEFTWHRPAGPSSIEVTSYCVLAYIHIGQDSDARELVLWLQKNQNSIGGYSSTQDTVMALQAISEYSAKYAKAAISTTRRVMMTVLDPAPNSNYTTIIDRSNTKILQLQELPDETSKVSVRVTGDLKSLAVVKIVWYFNTLANSDQVIVQEIQESKKLKISTTTSMLRPGFHTVRTCINKDKSLTYNSMVVVTMNLPSGCGLENIDQTRQTNPNIPRIEQASPDQVHFYLHQPENQCMEATIEEKVKVENLKPGTVEMYAYYDPETRDEGEITLALECVSKDCKPSSHATSLTTIGTFLLAACISLLLSLVIAV